MRILVIGAGGVGSAVVPIAVRRDFFERMVVADYDLGRAERAVARFPDDARLVAARVDASRAGRRRGALPRARHHPRPQRGRPALRDADLRGRLRGRRGLPRHGDVAVAPGSGRAVRADRRQARRRAVRGGRRVGGGRTPGPRRGRRRAGPVGRLRPLRPGPPVHRDRRGRRPRRGEPRRRRLRLRAVVLDLDDDRGVPQPAGHLGGGPGLVHDAAVQRARGVRLPGGDRAGRVRQRRARGGPARPALGQGASG